MVNFLNVLILYSGLFLIILYSAYCSQKARKICTVSTPSPLLVYTFIIIASSVAAPNRCEKRLALEWSTQTETNRNYVNKPNVQLLMNLIC